MAAAPLGGGPAATAALLGGGLAATAGPSAAAHGGGAPSRRWRPSPSSSPFTALAVFLSLDLAASPLISVPSRKKKTRRHGRASAVRRPRGFLVGGAAADPGDAEGRRGAAPLARAGGGRGPDGGFFRDGVDERAGGRRRRVVSGRAVGGAVPAGRGGGGRGGARRVRAAARWARAAPPATRSSRSGSGRRPPRARRGAAWRAATRPPPRGSAPRSTPSSSAAPELPRHNPPWRRVSATPAPASPARRRTARRRTTRELGAPDHHRGWSQAIGISDREDRVSFLGLGKIYKGKNGTRKIGRCSLTFLHSFFTGQCTKSNGNGIEGFKVKFQWQ